MTVKLRDYQQEALKLAIKIKYSLLCMKPRAGKTIISMFLVRFLTNKNFIDKTVIACTKTATVPFQSDFSKRGGVDLKIIDNFEDYLEFISDDKSKVCVIKHSLFEKLGYNQNNIDLIKDQLDYNPKNILLIIDEAHKLSNVESIGHTAFMNIRFMFDRITLLTATPYSSCLSQFYGLIHLIYPKLWRSKRAFYDDHIEEKDIKDWRTGKFLRKEKVRYKNLQMLRERVKPFTFFYFPPAPLHFIEHKTDLTNYEEYDKICMGVITEEDLNKNDK